MVSKDDAVELVTFYVEPRPRAQRKPAQGWLFMCLSMKHSSSIEQAFLQYGNSLIQVDCTPQIWFGSRGCSLYRFSVFTV